MTEALNLTWADIDWNEKIAWVWTKKNRTHLPKRQPVFLSEKALEILQEIKNGQLHGKWIFINPVTGKPLKDPRSALCRAIKKGLVSQCVEYTTCAISSPND